MYVCVQYVNYNIGTITYGVITNCMLMLIVWLCNGANSVVEDLYCVHCACLFDHSTGDWLISVMIWRLNLISPGIQSISWILCLHHLIWMDTHTQTHTLTHTHTHTHTRKHTRTCTHTYTHTTHTQRNLMKQVDINYYYLKPGITLLLFYLRYAML